MLYKRPVPKSEVREAKLHKLNYLPQRRWCSYSYDCSIQKLVFVAAVWRRHLVPLRLCEKHLKAVY